MNAFLLYVAAIGCIVGFGLGPIIVRPNMGDVTSLVSILSQTENRIYLRGAQVVESKPGALILEIPSAYDPTSSIRLHVLHENTSDTFDLGDEVSLSLERSTGLLRAGSSVRSRNI